MYKQSQINAIKALEARTPVSEQVKNAREKARKQLEEMKLSTRK